jgi:hypothetical protein
MRLTALAVSLAGCSTSSPAVDQLTVTTDNIFQTKTTVARSTLPLSDKTAFAAFAQMYVAHPERLTGKTVRTIINQELAYEVGLRLAAQDRASDAALRTKMARLVEATVVGYGERQRALILHMRVRNKSGKAITSFEAGMQVHDASGRRIGLLELRVTRSISAGGVARWDLPMTYARFGEDAPSMRRAVGQRKTIALNFTQIIYADGTEAGADG